MQTPYFYSVPSSDEKAGVYTNQKLSGTGTTESHTLRPLVPSRGHMLIVGAVPVFIRFALTTGLANAVDATRDIYVPANTAFPFLPTKNAQGEWGTVVVYAEAADGSSAYTVDVFQAI